MSALDPTREDTTSPTLSTNISLPLLPEAKSTLQLLTTLRAHQIMLTNLYIAQHTLYVTAYNAFAAQCATGEISFAEIEDAVLKLLEQQKEITLFQTFLWSFQTLVVGLESDEIDELDEGYAGRQGGVVIGLGGGKLTKSVNGMWR